MSVETLLYIVSEGKVLLIKKKRGLGAGLYNGVGGKVEKGELPIDAAIRECIEEIGVKPGKLEWMGLIEFVNDNSVYSYVHIFIAREFNGEPKETDEALPIWVPIDKIPYEEMWEDDRYWLPLVLRDGKKIYASFHFTDDWNKLTKSQIYILQEMPIQEQE